MLSRPLYELLPYAYLAGAAATLWLTPPGLAHGFALLLFAGGAFVWVARSNARRRDRRKALHGAARHGVHLPYAGYEFYPFAVAATAVWIIALWPALPVVVLSAMLLGYSLWVLGLRAQRRGHGWLQLHDGHSGIMR